MRRALILAVFLGALSASCFSGSSAQQAQAVASYPCFGAGINPGYVAANDANDGTVDGQISYSEQRFYIEEQTWATPRTLPPGHHSEHIHFGACIPNAQTMTAPFQLDLAYTFHNMQDYVVTQASEQAVTQAGSRALWNATAAQVQTLDNAAQASCPTCPNNVQNVYFSVTTTAPNLNGFKEIRGSITVAASGPNAVFINWQNDVRWYETDNFVGKAGSSPLTTQLALRVRPIVQYCTAGITPCDVHSSYHHAGWSGQSPQDTSTCGGVLTGTNSAVWDGNFVSQPWGGAAKTVCLYVTDGGGPAFLMIDPDFHHHYDAPTADCPNVDDHGNCLGKWFWQPSNTRKELFSPPHNFPVTIPQSVLDGLAPGLHKLVFRSDDPPECVRQADFVDWHLCPADARGTWSNISVLPFLIPGDTQAPSTPTGLAKSNPQPSSLVLSWNASSDNVGVAGYHVFRDGVQVADVTGTQATVGGLSAPSHQLQVEAYDVSGNISPRASVTATRSWN